VKDAAKTDGEISTLERRINKPDKATRDAVAHMLQRLQAEAAAARGEKNGSNQRDVSDDGETDSSESGGDDRDADSDADSADVDARKPKSAGSGSREEEAEESGEEAERSADTISRRQRAKRRRPAKAAASGPPRLPSNVENLSSKDLQSLMRAVKSAISVAQKKLVTEELAVA
jgi:hypothetical protein